MATEAYSGLLIETDEGVKSIADTTLEDIGGNTYFDEGFLKRQIVYPQPSVPEFRPEMIWTGIHDWAFIFGSPSGRGSKNIIVSEGKLYSYTCNLSGNKYILTRSWLLDRESPYGGKLSPVYFPVSMQAEKGDFFIKTLAYDFSDYGVMFDETVGRFLIVSNFGSTLKVIPENQIPVFEGWYLLYGSHTNLPNTCVAVFAKGEIVKTLLLQLPKDVFDDIDIKVLAEVEMPLETMNSQSDFYNYKATEFMLVSVGNSLLLGNIREWESGIAPKPVFSLQDIGYDSHAKIMCFEMSRTEKASCWEYPVMGMTGMVMAKN